MGGEGVTLVKRALNVSLYEATQDGPNSLLFSCT